jgi:hypothetical protein
MPGNFIRLFAYSEFLAQEQQLEPEKKSEGATLFVVTSLPPAMESRHGQLDAGNGRAATARGCAGSTSQIERAALNVGSASLVGVASARRWQAPLDAGRGRGVEDNMPMLRYFACDRGAPVQAFFERYRLEIGPAPNPVDVVATLPRGSRPIPVKHLVSGLVRMCETSLEWTCASRLVVIGQ